MICDSCGQELVEVDNPLRYEFRHQRGQEINCPRFQTRLRTGRKLGRTIYQQIGSEPSDDDKLVGMMDTPEIAAELVRVWNSR